jgi:hypothetical protein
MPGELILTYQSSTQGCVASEKLVQSLSIIPMLSSFNTRSRTFVLPISRSITNLSYLSPRFLHKQDDVLRTYCTRIGNGLPGKSYFSIWHWRRHRDSLDQLQSPSLKSSSSARWSNGAAGEPTSRGMATLSSGNTMGGSSGKMFPRGQIMNRGSTSSR